MPNNTALQKEFIDQNYQSKIAQLELFIQLSKNSLQALYFSAADKKFVGFKEYYLGEHEGWSQSLDPIRKAVQDFSKEFKKVHLCLSSPLYTLVPTVLYQDSVAKDYLLLNHQAIIKPSEVKSNAISSLQLTVVFEIPFLIENIFQTHFNVSTINHESVALLDYFGAVKTKVSQKIYLHVQYHHFHLLCFTTKGLRYFNRFDYTTIEDFMYFLLYAFEQLSIDRENTVVEVYGEIETDSALYKLINTYVRHVSRMPRPKDIQESQVLTQLGDYSFFNLFNQYLCEL